jgi:hypothetical protein
VNARTAARIGFLPILVPAAVVALIWYLFLRITLLLFLFWVVAWGKESVEWEINFVRGEVRNLRRWLFWTWGRES